MRNLLQALLVLFYMISGCVELFAAEPAYVFPLPQGWVDNSIPNSERIDYISPEKSVQISVVHKEIEPMNIRAFWYFFYPELISSGFKIEKGRDLTPEELKQAGCSEGYESILEGITQKKETTRSILWILIKDRHRVFLITATVKQEYFKFTEQIVRKSIGQFRAY
jgi:hypothetical protein